MRGHRAAPLRNPRQRSELFRQHDGAVGRRPQSFRPARARLVPGSPAGCSRSARAGSSGRVARTRPRPGGPPAMPRRGRGCAANRSRRDRRVRCPALEGRRAIGRLGPTAPGSSPGRCDGGSPPPPAQRQPADPPARRGSCGAAAQAHARTPPTFISDIHPPIPGGITAEEESSWASEIPEMFWAESSAVSASIATASAGRPCPGTSPRS